MNRIEFIVFFLFFSERALPELWRRNPVSHCTSTFYVTYTGSLSRECISRIIPAKCVLILSQSYDTYVYIYIFKSLARKYNSKASDFRKSCREFRRNSKARVERGKMVDIRN